MALPLLFGTVPEPEDKSVLTRRVGAVDNPAIRLGGSTGPARVTFRFPAVERYLSERTHARAGKLYTPMSNTAPTVSITMPTEASRFESGESIEFGATAMDMEDGDLTESLSWTSDRDGVIGASPSFSTAALSEGAHLITASATDSGGLTGQSQVTLTVAEAVVFVGAGDIAGCALQNDEGTAALLDDIPGTVFTLGDHAYPNGTAQEFTDCYDPTWGRHKGRSRPSTGNHDYHTPGASAYFDYFGAVAGNPAEGYYSYDLGDWHVIALNSNCVEVGGCDPDSPQGTWLQADLAASPSTCTLAYFHHPRFSSGNHGNSAFAVDFFEMLYEAGGDVVLSAHDHDYERFAPQDPGGAQDPEHGIRQFVVGTGGATLQPIAALEPNSEARTSETHGVLKLTLHPTRYEWEFIPVAGMTFTDSGSGDCVDAAQPPVTAIQAPTDGAVLKSGDPVSFVGEAIDPEDGDMTASLTWTSDRDGPIGTEGSFSITTLSAGAHEITAQATNSRALTGIDQVSITVLPTAGTIFTESSIASSSDDAEESETGVVSLGSLDLELVVDPANGANQTVGVRFQGVQLPQGASLSDAYIQFQVDEISPGPSSLVIEGEAVDHASTFVSSGANVSARPRTNAAVFWSPPEWLTVGEAGFDQRTPNIAPVLQEIVSRPGWKSGNSLAILITGNGTRTAEAYDGDPIGAPSLHLSHEGPQFTDRVLIGDLVDDNRFYLACNTITLGPDFHIAGPGSVVVRAGSRITLRNGFSVGSGARVTMQLDPACTVDTLPVVTIATPPDGSSFDFGDPVDFVGAATDEEDGDLAARLSWVSDRDGNIGSGGAVSTNALSPGLHSVTAWVTDDGGLSGSDRIIVTINNTPPSTSITAPPDGSSFEPGESIVFTGTASDPEDGDLTASLAWVSDLDGSIGAGGSFSTSALSNGQHTITASVTDSEGLSTPDQITLAVANGAPPNVSITAPASGAAFDLGESIDFSGTGGDAEDGDLTAALSWTSTLDGNIGIGGSFVNGGLSLGQHTIIASVTDSDGLTASDQIMLTVNNTPPTVSISLPVSGTSYEFGETVDFSGTASDEEDGDLTASLVWNSDLDGNLGTGGALSTSSLSSGSHTITAFAVDGEGLMGEAQVSLAVDEPAPSVVEVRVFSSSDDAEEKPTGFVTVLSSDLELVEEGATQTVGIRFDAVDVPRDAAISDAYIQFQVDEIGSVPTFLVVEGESADHAFAFVGSSGNVSSRPRTASSVVWTPPAWMTVGAAGSGQRTPDLSSLIQEIVSRPGWSSGNALSVVITGAGKRTAEAFDGAPNGAPLLHVEYRGLAGNRRPVVTIDAPANGTTFEIGESIVFAGTGIDGEDGDLTATLSWESDRDGLLGTGGSVTRSDLSEGVHIVTATANDTDGLTGFDQALLSVSSTAVVLVGAGDIAGCSAQNDEGTAALLDNIPGTVFTLGDHAYPDGTAQEFADCYDPTWGRHKARTRPSAGNHDYHTPGATGYFDYFGTAAGNPNEGYYSYDVGSWHFIVLNSNCAAVGGCDPGSPQGQWLQADLAANPASCTLAYSHHPRFSSGKHGGSFAAVDLFEMLYDGGADVVLAAHDHDYERFAPQDPNGNLDENRGIRQFVVGTGGAALRDFATVEPNSEVRYRDSHGVLKLTLHATSYEWEFVPVAGSTFTDTGTGACVVVP